MIYRNEKHEKNFTILSNSIPEDPRLSLAAKGMLWYLLAKPPKWRIYKSQLKTALKVSRWSFDSAFKELETVGHIIFEHNKWNVYETPRNVGGQHPAGGQHQEDQEVVSVANIVDVGGQHEVCCLPASECAGGQHLVSTDSKDSVSKDGRKDGGETRHPAFLPNTEGKKGESRREASKDQVSHSRNTKHDQGKPSEQGSVDDSNLTALAVDVLRCKWRAIR